MADKFLDDFFQGREFRKRGETPDTKYSVRTDAFDAADYKRILAEVDDYRVAERRLQHFLDQIEVSDTSQPMMADTFFSLMKVAPLVKPSDEVRPSHRVNNAIVREMLELTNYDALHLHTMGDPIGAAISCDPLEPEVEELFNRLKSNQDLAKSLEEQMKEFLQNEETLEEIEQQLQSLIDKESDGEGEGSGDGKSQELKDQKAALEAQQKALEERIRNGSEELDKQLHNEGGTIRQSLNRGLKEALEKAEQEEAMTQAWGLEPGQLQRMDAQTRLDIAKRLDSEKFRALANLIGPMMRLAFAEQSRKVNRVPEEIYDVELGNDLPHMLPTELAYLSHPVLKLDWIRRFLERGLMQYSLRGTERVAKGGIIFCGDSSGSMGGAPNVYCAGLGLALLHVAKAQKRPFTGIHFGSPGEFIAYEFDTPADSFNANRQAGFNGKIDRIEGIEAVIDFAEIFLCSGTDFVTPLTRALQQLQAEHRQFGATKGDIVFVTDGICGVPEDWKREFKEEQARLGFRVFGIIIGGSPKSEPLNELCDGRVVGLGDIVDASKRGGSEAAWIFSQV